MSRWIVPDSILIVSSKSKFLDVDFIVASSKFKLIVIEFECSRENSYVSVMFYAVIDLFQV